jgi:hypothetical protein
MQIAKHGCKKQNIMLCMQHATQLSQRLFGCAAV